MLVVMAMWLRSDRLRLASGLAASALLFAACDGRIDGPAASILVAPPPSASAPPSASPSSSATPRPTPTAMPPAPVPFVPAPPVLPRLTVEQYRLTALELLGAPLPAIELDPDTTPHLYSSIGATRTAMSDRLTSQLEVAARTLVAPVFASPERRAALVGCAPASVDDPCIAAFVARFGRLAFRRALTPEEVASYTALVRAQGEPVKGLRVATTAMLLSPWYLYRFERGAGTGAARTIVGDEMASRLAFLVWNTGPDAALLDDAAAGRLDTVDGIRAVLPRLMADPRAARSARAFFREYMGANSFATLHRDAAAFPRWEEGLGESMREELERFVESLVAGDGDLRRLFDQRETFVDARLARFYGLDPVSGWTRVRWPESSGRAGLLSLSGVLAFTSHENTTSPTRRGVFIRERLLCETVPAPPPDVVTQLPPEGGAGRVLTVRERLEEHRRNPQCAGCHSAFDPLGLGLEEFDASGALRAEEAGRPVDNSGEFGGRAFHGARELGQLLAEDTRVMRCLARQVFRRAVGRLDTVGEAPAIDLMAAALERGRYRWSALVEAVAVSDAFRIAAAPTEGN